MSNEIIMLYSGGADSRLMLEFAIDLYLDPIALLIDYGQLHAKELECAKQVLKNHLIRFHEIKLGNLEFRSALTSNEKGLYPNVSEWHVPNRNMILLSIACGMAESKGINKVWYGADYSDFDHLFPDCTQKWLGKMNEVLKISSTNHVQIEAPLLGFTKEMILTMLENKGIKSDEFFSGYGDL